MRVRLALQVGMAVACATLMACGGAAVSNSRDSGVKPCQDDQDCDLGYSCTGGYCQPSVPIDAGPDVAQTPKMLLSPTLLDFGDAYVGGEFTLSFTIGNIGGAPLTVSEIDLIEDHTVGAFTVQAKPVPFTVDAAGSETVTVILRPNDTNVPTGSVVVHSDDPNWTPSMATVQLISRSKGSPDLSVCAHRTDDSTCMESSPGNAIIDYGTVDYGSSTERLVDLSNSGDTNVSLQITGIALPDPTHFTLSLVQLIPDPLNPGQFTEQSATLPFLLSAGDPTATPPVPGTQLRVHLVFTALGIAGTVPSGPLLITDSTTPTPTSVPIIGIINGCIPYVTDAGVLDGGSDPQNDPHNCGTCGNDCTAQLTGHAATAACHAGVCAVGTCDPGYYDVDGVFSDGCECATTGMTPNSCAAPAQFAAPVTLTGNNLMPPGSVHWYEFTFATNGTCIKPSIYITSGDPSIVLDLYTDCAAGGVACTGTGETGTVIGLRGWDVTYGTCGAHQSIDPAPGTPPFWQPATPLVYYVKVYATGTSTGCLPYTLAVTQ